MKSFLKHIVVKILTWEAQMLLRKHQPFIIAVTGSVGKTSTKDAIYEVIKRTTYVRKSEKSYNSDIGVPLTVLGLKNAWSNPILWCKNLVDGLFLLLFQHEYPKILVLEMGVDRPGDMEKLTAWIQPDVVVMTRLPDVPVHVEYFATPEAVIEEKLKLLSALKPEGHFIYNQDDERLVKIAQSTFQKSFGYSRYAHALFMAQRDEVLYEHSRPVGMRFTITHLTHTASVTIQGSVGLQHVYTCAAAAAVASVCEVSLADAAGYLSLLVPPPGRMRIVEGIKNSTIIDDSYNASPIAAEQSLATLRELRGTKRRIAVLGDMMELGQFSIREHERIGRVCAQSCDVLVTIGVRARGFSKGALEAGMHEKNIIECDTAEYAGELLDPMLSPGDVVLVKGSQSIRAERCVEAIMAHPEHASELLVRQSNAWQVR